MYNFFPLSVVFKLHKSHQLVMLLEFKEGVTWRRKRRTGGCPSPGGWRSSSLGWTGAGDTASPTSRKSLLTTSQLCSNYSTSSCHLARECTLHRLQLAKSPAYSLCRTGQVDTGHTPACSIPVSSKPVCSCSNATMQEEARQLATLWSGQTQSTSSLSQNIHSPQSSHWTPGQK